MHFRGPFTLKLLRYSLNRLHNRLAQDGQFERNRLAQDGQFERNHCPMLASASASTRAVPVETTANSDSNGLHGHP